ncbi:MAG: PPC domain-containing protein [Bacteroidota bacterium]
MNIYRINSFISCLGLMFLGSATICHTALAQSTMLLNEQGMLQDGDEAARDGSLYDVHTFEGVVGQEVIIRIESTDFDTYLGLGTSSGNFVAGNDDIDQGTTNSEVRVRLSEDGTYLVIVKAYDASGRGRYTLSATSTESVNASNQSDSALLPGIYYKSSYIGIYQHGERICYTGSNIRGSTTASVEENPNRLGIYQVNGFDSDTELSQIDDDTLWFGGAEYERIEEAISFDALGPGLQACLSSDEPYFDQENYEN